MLNKKIEEICNRQVEREGYSSNLYLAMASWAENKGLIGVAAWIPYQHMYEFDRDIVGLRKPAANTGATT
jgi:ferritin